ncbi:MAG TPA: flagellar type III secretion system pore protein FliP [Gemmatimonadales bacterium]|nr:flagellar type III secretion system pore protein FliP [Gemmatimonadales bacterium]
MLSLLAALAVTIGLLLLTLQLLRRIQQGGAAPGQRVPLRIVQRISTGPKQAVALLRVGERVLVVSLAERGATLLAELDGEERRLALDDAPRTPGRPSGPPPFTQLLRGFGLVAALALAPAALRGQAAPPPAAAVPQQPQAVRQAPVAGQPAAAAPATGPVATPIQAYSPPPDKRTPVAPHAPTPAGPDVAPPPMPKIEFRIGEGANEVKLSGTVGLVVFMGALTLLPALFLLMTSFTRILIVLHFLRSAIGTQATPPTQVLVALAVLLTGVVMHPVTERVNREALTPYFDGKLSQAEAYSKGLVPFREFMLANTREQDVASFAEMSGVTDVKALEDLPTVTIVAAFVTSELRTAFQMGFVIFLPFIVVDMIVASVLMSMGMMMLPPMMVSLPFKLLLFVLADGWTLVVRNLVASFRV